MPAELIHRPVEIPDDPANKERVLSDLKMAAAPSLFPNPKLSPPAAASAVGSSDRSAANTGAASGQPSDEATPPPPVVAAGGTGDASGSLRRLIAISANPAPPGGPIEVPPGNRAGAFSAGQLGKVPGTPYGSLSGLEGAGAVGPAAAGDDVSAARIGNGAGIRIPGLLVSGPAGPPPAGPIVAAPPSPAPAPRASLPSPVGRGTPASERNVPPVRSTGPSLPDWRSIRPQELGFSPGKKIYTVYINMPNLSSGAGSWVLRFTELAERKLGDETELAAPVALRKIDPGYVPDAIRDKVQGQVVLRAIIRSDGRVEHVEVQRSLDPRLDERAVNALLRWEFQPATRNGLPVDLEAVIQIPFSLPKAF
jgi:TonB family protein